MIDEMEMRIHDMGWITKNANKILRYPFTLDQSKKLVMMLEMRDANWFITPLFLQANIPTNVRMTLCHLILGEEQSHEHIMQCIEISPQDIHMKAIMLIKAWATVNDYPHLIERCDKAITSKSGYTMYEEDFKLIS